MSKLTEKYGKFVSLYEGEGKLNQQECKFEIGQRPDSTIIVYYPFWGLPQREVERSEIELNGFTEDAINLVAEGKVNYECTIHPGIIESFNEFYYKSLRPFHLTIGEADWSKAHSIKFAITNFIFSGNETQAYDRLNLNLDDLNVSFQKVADYDEIYNSVVGGNKTEVTCELTIEVAGRSQKEILEFARNICDLLTIAKGRKINWINYKVYDANSSIIFTSHQSQLTDPNNGYELINFRQAQMAITYLEQCYPAYKQFDLCHPTMLNEVANIIVDANTPRFFLNRALIMFSMVDALSKKVSSNRDFTARIRCLKTLYNVCLDDEEISFFVKSRNSVVHKLKFRANDMSDMIEEYEKCYHTFHRLLLRILDYQSHYFDITLQRYSRIKINILRPCP